MLSYKHLILSVFLLGSALQADVVHYDKKKVKSSSISKPNHPGL